MTTQVRANDILEQHNNEQVNAIVNRLSVDTRERQKDLRWGRYTIEVTFQDGAITDYRILGETTVKVGKAKKT